MLNIKLKGKKNICKYTRVQFKGYSPSQKKNLSLSIQPLNKDLIQMWVECLIN